MDQQFFPRRLLARSVALLSIAGALCSAQASETESARIRQHHVSRLMAKLASPAEELERSCRYESEIATAPPANRVALTFDDGPQPGETELVLDVLAQHGISATFFMIGEKAARYPELVARVRAAGHQVVANHSWSHPNFHDINAAQQADEIERGDALLEVAAGPKLFRYPYGNSSCAGNALVRQRGYKIVGWHIDSCDWAYEKTGAVDAREALTCGVPPQYRDDYVGHIVAAARARKGGIILMHEIHPRTVRQLDKVIEQLLAAGFVFSTVNSPEFQDSLR